MIQIHRAPAAVLALAAMLFLGACDLGSLLDVARPNLVTPEDIQGARGAELFAAGALGQFELAYGAGSAQIVLSGLMADEFHFTSVQPPTRDVDRRAASERNDFLSQHYRDLHQARVGLENAADIVQEFLPGDSRVAEMLGLAGFTYLFFGEHFCSGVPFGRTLPNGEAILGTQQTTEQTFGIALERFDAAAAATAGSADLGHLAAVGGARALLDLGQYAEAAARVSGVPTGWVYLIRYKQGTIANVIYARNRVGGIISLSDREGGNGIPFRSLDDARLGWFQDGGRTGFDNRSLLYEQTKYDSYGADIVLASGIEARLVEAEAALQTGDGAAMMTTLNALRATLSLGDLTDPGTPEGRVDLLFSERARWMFATAHRLGDMRRLVRHYGRGAETVFPTGEYYDGGVYGTDVDFVIPADENPNPNYSGCFDRGA